MEELLKSSTLDNLVEGSIIKGTIIEIRPTEVVIDIGGKSEGIVNANEFVDVSELQVGSELEVFLEKLEDKEGNPVVSFDKAEQKKNWEKIVENCEEGSIIQGRVRSKVKGGLIVSIGVDSFMPASQIDVQPPKNLDQYVGQTYDFKVIKINLDRKNIVVSRRELIEEQRMEKRRALLDEVKPGDTRRGQVKNITDYGAFVDLDGLDGLLHITDMSWGRINHPSEMVKQGEEIEVMIIEIDRERERVSLGLKQLANNPWEKIEEKYPVGTTVNGKVVNLVPYGAFIEIEEGVEGLVHVTELSWTKRISKPSEVLKIGDEIQAVVLGVQKDEQKISLALANSILTHGIWLAITTQWAHASAVRFVISLHTEHSSNLKKVSTAWCTFPTCLGHARSTTHPRWSRRATKSTHWSSTWMQIHSVSRSA
jgi:small subunit ribosomal protein S1